MEPGRIELPTPCVQGRCSPSWAMAPIRFLWRNFVPGDFFEIHGVSVPFKKMSSAKLVGLGGFEPPTSPLSGVRSNQLSYRPNICVQGQSRCLLNQNNLLWVLIKHCMLCKEVIQPQVPLGLPCYDFTPVMNHKVVSALPKVRLPTSFATHSHGVTGGVYKARERIHRDILIRDY